MSLTRSRRQSRAYTQASKEVAKIKALILETPYGYIDFIGDTEVRLGEAGLQGVGASAQINTQTSGNKDGSVYTGGRYPERPITVPFRIRNGADAEMVQYDLYRIFAPTTKGTLTMHARTCSSCIDFIVEAVEIPPNQKPPMTGYLLLRCPDPFFRALTSRKEVIAGSVSYFKFPFTFPSEPFYISKRQEGVFREIINNGINETALTVVMTAKARVKNPYLEDVDTGGKMELNYTMQARDIITITTGKDNKKIILTRDGEDINLINYKKFPFEFLQLRSGKNLYKFGAASGVDSLEITAEFSEKFPGIYCNVPGGTERISDTELAEEIREIANIVRRNGLYG